LGGQAANKSTVLLRSHKRERIELSSEEGFANRRTNLENILNQIPASF
jgi:hypothetical protein